MVLEDALRLFSEAETIAKNSVKMFEWAERNEELRAAQGENEAVMRAEAESEKHDAAFGRAKWREALAEETLEMVLADRGAGEARGRTANDLMRLLQMQRRRRRARCEGGEWC